MMRRMLCAAVLAAAVSSLVFAQGATVAIQNEEQSTFYYIVDPTDLAQVTPGSPLAATKVASFFAAAADQPQFTALAPGEQASLTGLSDGPHLLVGFFAVDQDTFPVRLITLQADSSMGERFYAVYGSPALVEATRGVGRLAQFARRPAPSRPPRKRRLRPHLRRRLPPRPWRLQGRPRPQPPRPLLLPQPQPRPWRPQQPPWRLQRRSRLLPLFPLPTIPSTLPARPKGTSPSSP